MAGTGSGGHPCGGVAACLFHLLRIAKEDVCQTLESVYVGHGVRVRPSLEQLTPGLCVAQVAGRLAVYAACLVAIKFGCW